MSIFDRMSSIEARMNQLEARLDSDNPGKKAVGRENNNITSGNKGSHQGVSFEHLLNSMSEEKRFKGASGASGVGKWAGDPHDFDGMISSASKKYNVDEHLIRAVIKQESAFNPKATSWCGAQGLMQLMPETAKDLGVENAYDPHQNIMGGTKYLRQLMDMFDGNLTKTIAAYNAGPGAVDKAGGVPDYAETQNYVAKVLGYYRENKGIQ